MGANVYDTGKLKTQQECRTVLERARRQNQLGVYNAVFRRLCGLTGREHDDPSDALIGALQDLGGV
jgi:hypothetical protein